LAEDRPVNPKVIRKKVIKTLLISRTTITRSSRLAPPVRWNERTHLRAIPGGASNKRQKSKTYWRILTSPLTPLSASSREKMVREAAALVASSGSYTTAEIITQAGFLQPGTPGRVKKHRKVSAWDICLHAKNARLSHPKC
jgi:hypothetical protein